MIEFILVVIFASAFVLAICWFVAMTIGKLPVVRNLPTLDDIQDFINPELAEERTRAQEELSCRAKTLSAAVRALADAGDKFGATKAYMDEAGFGIMESKKTVEAYMSNRGHEQ